MTDAEYIAMLENEIKKRDKRIDKLEVENECLRKDNHIYLEALILSKHRIFGKSSEHTEDEGQQSFFNEAEAEYAEKPEEPVSKTVKGYTRKSPKTKRDELIKSIETEIITCTIPDEEQICPRCGLQMKVIGKKYIREEVELIPAKLVVKKYYSNTYSCKKCEKKNMPVFLHGLVPAPVLPHSLASASTVAWVIYQKYVNAVPLYRQEKDWERLGYSLSRTTMANWVIRCSEDYFSRFIARLKTEMLTEDALHCDETYVKVLREKDVSANSKQYMWVYRTGKHSERQQLQHGSVAISRAGRSTLRGLPRLADVGVLDSMIASFLFVIPFNFVNFLNFFNFFNSFNFSPRASLPISLVVLLTVGRVLVGKELLVQMQDVLFGNAERQSAGILAALVHRHAQLLGQPVLVVHQVTHLQVSLKHQPQSFSARGDMCQQDTLAHLLIDSLPHLLRVIHVVDIQHTEAVQQRRLLFAPFTLFAAFRQRLLKICLEDEGGLGALLLRVARSPILLLALFHLWVAHQLPEELLRTRLRRQKQTSLYAKH